MTFLPHQIEDYSEPDLNDNEPASNGSYTGYDSSYWNGSTYGLKAIGHGTAGIVFALDEELVVKVYVGADNRNLEDYETERQAYENLANGSRHVLTCFELQNPDGLVLERCQGTLRSKIKSRRGEHLRQSDVLTYAIQAAEGLAYVHNCGIIQGDGKYSFPATRYAKL